LFADTAESGDIESGTIYVLRSQSEHPFVKEHHEFVHKIGVTGGKVETRIAAAAKDATYLLAEVEVVATWFLVPLHVIDEAVQRILDGTITDIVYDPSTARLVRESEVR